MSATNSMENAVLLLYFNNTAHALIGDAPGLQPSATPGNFFLSLHTADPGETGTQATNECAYTNYARQPVTRNGSAGFTVAGDTVTLTSAVSFPSSGSGGEVATHWGLGVAVSGSTVLLFKGTITPNINIFPAVVPILAATTNIIAA